MSRATVYVVSGAAATAIEQPLGGVANPVNTDTAALAALMVGDGGLAGFQTLGTVLDSTVAEDESETARLATMARIVAFDEVGAVFRRLLMRLDNSDAQDPGDGQNAMLAAIARLTGYDSVGDVWNRVAVIRTDDEEFIATTAIADAVNAFSRSGLWDGTQWRFGRAMSGANGDPSAAVGGALTADLPEFSASNAPAAATQATVTVTNGTGGERIVARSITARIATAGTAQTPIHVVLRDGATGVGAILWETVIACPVNSADGVVVPCNIVGSVDTDMTLEFAAAGVAASEQAVALTGYHAL